MDRAPETAPTTTIRICCHSGNIRTTGVTIISLPMVSPRQLKPARSRSESVTGFGFSVREAPLQLYLDHFQKIPDFNVRRVVGFPAAVIVVVSRARSGIIYGGWWWIEMIDSDDYLPAARRTILFATHERRRGGGGAAESRNFAGTGHWWTDKYR